MSTPKTLRPRLQALFGLITAANQQTRYHCIWDCCCDHGNLGIKLVADGIGDKIVFVDCVESIVALLQPRLAYYPPNRFELQVADAANLQLDQGQRHLIVLAGVGGELSANIINGIEAGNPDCEIDYLCCPNTSQFDLREYLAAQRWQLYHEDFVAEGKWDYEIIFCSNRAATEQQQQVTLTGQHWQSENEMHRRYLLKILKHYENQSRGCNSGRAQSCLDAYRACWQGLGF